jgi:hypothetical protein
MEASYIKRKGKIVGVRVKGVIHEGDRFMFEECLNAAGKKLKDVKFTDCFFDDGKREIMLDSNELSKFLKAWNYKG